MLRSRIGTSIAPKLSTCLKIYGRGSMGSLGHRSCQLAIKQSYRLSQRTVSCAGSKLMRRRVCVAFANRFRVGDTHYVLWSAINSARKEPWSRKLLANLNNEILVSAASIYEISLKVRYGMLPEAVEFENDLIANIESRLGYTLLPLEPETMMRAARFEVSHADPFDRMIAAQAIQNNLPVLSTDPRLDAFGVRRLKKPKPLLPSALRSAGNEVCQPKPWPMP